MHRRMPVFTKPANLRSTHYEGLKSQIVANANRAGMGEHYQKAIHRANLPEDEAKHLRALIAHIRGEKHH